MAKLHKQETRRKFRDAVFKRDSYRCVVCGFQSSPARAEHEIDAHHITPREQLPNGGYVKENGVTLCDAVKQGRPAEQGCHYQAEQMLQRLSEGLMVPEQSEYAPDALYLKIHSNLGLAQSASERLR